MKKYIKIDKNTTEEMAVEHLKSLCGEVYNNLCKGNGNEIIKLDDMSCILYTNCTEQGLLDIGYEEIKLPSFKQGEQIAVSDESEKEAIKDLEDDPGKCYYTWGITKDGSYIVEFNTGYMKKYKYIAKIPKEIPKEETIEIGGQTYNKEAFEKAVKDLKPIY